MIVEVREDFDGGVVEPGDRGMVTSKGTRVMFRTRVPTIGPMALYDWGEGPRWRIVESTEREWEAYAEKRSTEFFDAVAALRWRGVPDMRNRANRDRLDAQTLAIGARCPGLLAGQICRFFFALPEGPSRVTSSDERVWKNVEASFRRHVDAGRIFDFSSQGWGRIWLTD